jgi:hypothetical protein
MVYNIKANILKQKHMITNYFTGFPCKLGKDSEGDIVFGRIIGETEKGSWNNVNDIDMFTIPKFCTPGGTVIETGLFSLYDLDDKDWEKLKDFEEQSADKKYNGLFTEAELLTMDKKAKDESKVIHQNAFLN